MRFAVAFLEDKLLSFAHHSFQRCFEMSLLLVTHLNFYGILYALIIIFFIYRYIWFSGDNKIVINILQ